MRFCGWPILAADPHEPPDMDQCDSPGCPLPGGIGVDPDPRILEWCQGNASGTFGNLNADGEFEPVLLVFSMVPGHEDHAHADGSARYYKMNWDRNNRVNPHIRGPVG